MEKMIRGAFAAGTVVCAMCASGMTEYFSEDFESGRMTEWTRSGGRSGIKTVSGKWRKLTAKFNSGGETNVMFNVTTDQNSQGNLWLDDFSSAPEVPVDNVSFEDGTKGWIVNNAAVDAVRAHEGKMSVHFSLPLESDPPRLLRRYFAVKPHTDYEFSIHMFVGDDFQGDCKFGVFDGPTGCRCLPSNYGEELFAATEVKARDRNGLKVFTMIPKGGKMAASRTVEMPAPGMNVCLSLDVRTDAFAGSFAATLVDPASGRDLLSLAHAGDAKGWRRLKADGIVPGGTVEVRLAAEGEGTLDVDNLLLTAPRTCPDVQHVEWWNAERNFIVLPNVKVAYEGPASELVESAIGLLEKDLKALGRTLARVAKLEEADVRLVVNPKKFRLFMNPAEGYELCVEKDHLLVGGAEPKCAFYGVMTILDLLGQHRERPYLPACHICDWPSLPVRGFMPGAGHTPEVCARLKLNTYMFSSGYPQTDAEWKKIGSICDECRAFGLEPMPFLGTAQCSYYVLAKNPNLGCGKFVRNEPVALKGTAPSELQRPFVIRTALSDIRVTSADGSRTYVDGKDYTVVPGDMTWTLFAKKDARRFALARCAGSSIADGETVHASYDAVVNWRPPYCTFEPEVRRLNDAYFQEFTKRLGLDAVCPMMCLMEMDEAYGLMREDSRVIASGKDPAVLMAEDLLRILDSVQKVNPKAKLYFYAGTVNKFARLAAPVLAKRAKDLVVIIWGYDVNWPNAYAVDAVKFWSGYGIDAVTMPWDNAKNVHGHARLAYDAVASGFGTRGMIGSSWGNRPGDVRDVASSAWRVPWPDERNYVEIKGLDAGVWESMRPTWKQAAVKGPKGVVVPAQSLLFEAPPLKIMAVPVIRYLKEKNRLLLTFNSDYPDGALTHYAMKMQSDDLGKTWSRPEFLSHGSPRFGIQYMTCDLGGGKLLAYPMDAKGYFAWRYLSEDFGETWKALSRYDALEGKVRLNNWDPPLYSDGVLYETFYTTVPDRPGCYRAGYRVSRDQGRTFEPAVFPDAWENASEINLFRTRSGAFVAGCRCTNPTAELDQSDSLCVSTSADGVSWTKMKEVKPWGRMHPSFVQLADGRLIMTYVVRNGYPDAADGSPRFGVEAVESFDDGRTWSDEPYRLAEFFGLFLTGRDRWASSVQSTSSILLPDGDILTAFGTAHRAQFGPRGRQMPRDVGLVRWNPLKVDANFKAVHRTRDLRVRDPFVVNVGGKVPYRLYMSDSWLNGSAGVSVSSSSDLENWSEPENVMKAPDWCGQVWAPEIHRWKDAWYMFVTLKEKPELKRPIRTMVPGDPSWVPWPGAESNSTCHAVWIYRSEKPEGPFVPVANRPITDPSWVSLDGTLAVEDGKPWMIFTHDWAQVRVGTYELAPMSEDLTTFLAPPRTLFTAAEFPMLPERGVTDGAFLYRSPKSGKLFMIWSTHNPAHPVGKGYCVVLAESATGRIAGPWTNHRLLFDGNGGHGMIFRKTDGSPVLCIHCPEEWGGEHPLFLPLVDDGDSLKVNVSYVGF